MGSFVSNPFTRRKGSGVLPRGRMVHSPVPLYSCLMLHCTRPTAAFDGRRKPGQNLNQVLGGICQANSKTHAKGKSGRGPPRRYSTALTARVDLGTKKTSKSTEQNFRVKKQTDVYKRNVFK